MATMAENVIAAGSKNCPPMLEKGMYDSWKTRIILYIRGKENGDMLIESINKVGDAEANQPRVIKCYNCRGERHIAKQCTAKKMVKDSEWFKDKMLFAQSQEARVVLHEEQQDFLADRLEENDDCNDLQLHTTSNFKADHVEAYDSDCDDQATASAIFMASLYPAGSLYGEIIAPTYDSNTLSEVPHYDTYHDDDVFNSDVQETEYTEHFVSHDDSYVEITSDSNFISYAEYMVTIKDEAAHYVPSLFNRSKVPCLKHLLLFFSSSFTSYLKFPITNSNILQ
ncbi:retrovirus-related pol polyprotein from transposon TNT 1-94 [Tanacetum coccineum]|uniref:Retrovirus-related pol polyprotein from transposon TNT 1-94 n=1 Tax=Tanacetum coccineum TaxID=301880 RepID=A0ABQ4YUN6_9ASTR